MSSVAFTGNTLSFTPRLSFLHFANPSHISLRAKSFTSLNFTSKPNHSSSSSSSFKTFVRTTQSEPKVSGGTSLKTLISAYKEALLDGDEKSVLDIEAMIYFLENEKNELALKVATLSSEVSSGKEKSIRLQADFENFRKRIEKDRLKVSSNAKEEVIECLLPVVDNFELAKQHIKPETEKEKKIDASYQGIYKQCVETMKSLNVAVVETVGKPFDPTVHEAVAREQSQEFKEGIVITEIRRGFILGDRVIRPAKVKVSSGHAIEKESVSSEPPEQPVIVLE